MAERAMYRLFFEWIEVQKAAIPDDEKDCSSKALRLQDEALVFFGRKDEYEMLVEKNSRRLYLKSIWNGTKVGEWTGWYGRKVGLTMKHVRQTIGEEKLAYMQEHEVKEIVLEAMKIVEERLKAEEAERVANGGE